MPAKLRADRVVPDSLNHVVLRGNNRRNLFSYSKDRVQFLYYLLRATKATQCRVHALALMTNHIHLLITPPSIAALSDCVRSCAHRYAMHRNREREGSGKLFEARFDSKPVCDDAYAAVVTAYIDLNAERAGLGARLTPWTTHAFHVGWPLETRIPEVLWTPSDWYLSLASDRAGRAEQYRAWVERYRAHRDELDEAHRLPAVGTRYTKRLERPSRERAA